MSGSSDQTQYPDADASALALKACDEVAVSLDRRHVAAKVPNDLSSMSAGTSRTKIRRNEMGLVGGFDYSADNLGRRVICAFTPRNRPRNGHLRIV